MEMKNELEVLKESRSEQQNLLSPEELENIEGGTVECQKGYSSGIFGTECDCGYKNTEEEEEAP